MTDEIREVSTRQLDDASVRTFIFTSPGGVRRCAQLIKPTAPGPYPAILYVHWYEPESMDSNRTQFYDEALEMASYGAASLLMETLWSDRDFFLKRTQAEDEDNSLQQVVELRTAMDILLDDVDIDARRFAYVGHDFGAMYGVVVGSIDPRPTHYVLMAGTPRFHEWYLYYPPLEGDARDKYIERMAQYDPIHRVATLAPAPLFFQFATDDFHVPVERAEDFFAAAQDPKRLEWYEAGHGLNEDARKDRMAWLRQQLNLT
ncbi:MAG: S9 family peptidase [Chloroflexi bacterium]|nr:S9 family peptidase [Chloroflexota bacterium]